MRIGYFHCGIVVCGLLIQSVHADDSQLLFDYPGIQTSASFDGNHLTIEASGIPNYVDYFDSHQQESFVYFPPTFSASFHLEADYWGTYLYYGVELQRFANGRMRFEFGNEQDPFVFEARDLTLVSSFSSVGDAHRFEILGAFQVEQQTLNLPGSNIWDSASTVSLLDGISLAINPTQDEFDWPSPIAWTGQIASGVRILELDRYLTNLEPVPPPDWYIPEPTTGLLACGLFLVMLAPRRHLGR